MESKSQFRKWYWGDEKATVIKSKEYANEKKKIKAQIDANPNHPNIIAAIHFIDDWLEKSHKGKSVPFWWLLGRLWEADVRGGDVLAETAAIWLFSLSRKGRVVNMSHLEHLIGNKVVRLVPYWGRTKGPEHKGIGRILNKNFKPLYFKLCKTVVTQEAKINSQKSPMAKPLEI